MYRESDINPSFRHRPLLYPGWQIWANVDRSNRGEIVCARWCRLVGLPCLLSCSLTYWFTLLFCGNSFFFLIHIVNVPEAWQYVIVRGCARVVQFSQLLYTHWQNYVSVRKIHTIDSYLHTYQIMINILLFIILLISVKTCTPCQGLGFWIILLMCCETL